MISEIQKKKCVLLLSRTPAPPISGYKIKTYNLVKILSELYDLTVIIVTDEPENNENIEFLKKHSKHYLYFTFPKWRFYWNTLKGLLFSSNPLQVSYYKFNSVHKKLASIIREADIIVPSLTRTTEYVLNQPRKSNSVIIFDTVDSYALGYARAISKTKSFLWKNIYSIESHRLHKYEKEIISQANASLLVNKEETEYWKKYGNSLLMPNGVKEELYNYDLVNTPENAIAFFGKMDYPPNIDAVKWYAKNVLPFLPAEVKFYIVGGSPGKSILKLENQYKNIEVTGYLDNPYDLLSKCLAVVAPMQTGGGIQNKVLETMALGQVNILSSLAANPIGGVDKKDFLIAETAEEHIEFVKLMYSNPLLRNEIGNNARNLIKQNFSWEKNKKSLKEIVEEQFANQNTKN
ncbi:glycosyltransferase [Moheibacter sediminis]|uniref:Glycosyltransferase involved in cell wall bisynthesis n=1 Tax=Moheibacter sediminis TaxID=1434700 RepID=A0A1W2ALC7_9FLAO|nr:glycosyltransferase [Moheibacter sediminis]SMC61496.1 Glycosyltransferase involved in cell wall bisynthesis [Moheibacter sediminis]